MDSTHKGGELLRLSGICLDYGQVEALKEINLVLYPSKVHAIVGEHGAGKTSIGWASRRSTSRCSSTSSSPSRRTSSSSTPRPHAMD